MTLIKTCRRDGRTRRSAPWWTSPRGTWRGEAGPVTRRRGSRRGNSSDRRSVGGWLETELQSAAEQNIFLLQARLLINYLTVVQQKRSNSISSEKVDMKNRKLFKKKVQNLMNVLRMTTNNKVTPRRNPDEEDFQVEVVLASKLAYFM